MLQGTRKLVKVGSMSRPTTFDEGPIVAVIVDNLAAAWCDGVWTGDDEIIDAAKFAILAKMTYVLHGVEVVASDQDPMGIAAALGSFRPGRTIFTACPLEVTRILSRHETPEFWAIAMSFAADDSEGGR
jgi:hypothetical protein